MSNKLTKKDFDLLIEKVIKENFTKANWQKLYHPSLADMDFEEHPQAKDMKADSAIVDAGPIFDAFSAKAKADNKIGLNDIQFFQSNPDKIDTTVQSQLIAISRLGFAGDEKKFDDKADSVFSEPKPKDQRSVEKWNKRQASWKERNKNRDTILEMALEAEKALKAYADLQAKVLTKQQTITSPKITTAGSDVPIFNQIQVNAIRKALSGAQNMEQATKMISDISIMFYKAATGDADALNQIKEKQPQEILNNIQLLELMATCIKEYNSQEAGYFMETLFAMLYNGKQAGKVKTSRNKDGAVDFTSKLSGTEEAGSAKMYKSITGISQSLVGFGDAARALKVGETTSITYICGIKKQDASKQGDLKLGMTAAPEKIILIDLFVIKYIIEKTGAGEEDYKVYHHKDQKQEWFTKDSSLDVTKSIQKGLADIYPVYLAEVRTKTFKEMIDASITEDMDSVFKAYQFFKKYYESLQAASDNAKEYINLGETQAGQIKGQQVYSNLADAEDNYTGLVSELTYEKKPTKKISENKKKSKKDLDILIEQVILKRLLEK